MKLIVAVLLGLLAQLAHATLISADAYIVTDMDGQVLMEHNADQDRAIGSITKLVVATNSVALDPDELIEITKEDIKAGRMRSTPLKAGQSYTRAQLTELALVPSDNVAAIALGRSVPDNVSEFAEIVEPSGLDPHDRSTARRIAELARSLFNTRVAELSTHPLSEIGLRHSTNPLLTREGWKFYLSKTGFINESGGCLVTITEIGGKVVTVVILGASGTKQRWLDLVEIRREMGDTDFYVPVKVKAVVKHVTHHKRKRK